MKDNASLTLLSASQVQWEWPGSGGISLDLVWEKSETSLNQFQQQVFGAVSYPTTQGRTGLKSKYHTYGWKVSDHSEY